MEKGVQMKVRRAPGKVERRLVLAPAVRRGIDGSRKMRLGVDLAFRQGSWERPQCRQCRMSATANTSAQREVGKEKLTTQSRAPAMNGEVTVKCPVEERGLRRSVALALQFNKTNKLEQGLAGGSLSPKELENAYAKCGEVTEHYAKTFYLGTQLMTPEKAKAIWAIYVWCRRTDELVDGPHASRITPKALERWEERLEATFAGKPYDMLDAALSDTVSKFPVDIQPFRDMIDGMRMDLVKSRYNSYEELYEYCYRVAGTVGLMTTPVMGIDPTYTEDLEEIYAAALSLGVANQLTNILRDVGEDTIRNRVYVPLDELREFGVSEEEVMSGSLSRAGSGTTDSKWQRFMEYQIKRARTYFDMAESGVMKLEQNARWPVLSALVLYQQILDGVERNGYDNFNTRAYVPKWKKISTLPVSYWMVVQNRVKEVALNGS